MNTTLTRIAVEDGVWLRSTPTTRSPYVLEGVFATLKLNSGVPDKPSRQIVEENQERFVAYYRELMRNESTEARLA
jgi:ligand-binding sensor domain-containing protein